MIQRSSLFIAFVLSSAIATSASAASLSCFDDVSFGTGRWVKIALRQLSSGKYDYTIEWSTGATATSKNLECHLAVIGTSPVLVDGGCVKSRENLDFRPGTYNGTMTVVQNLAKTLGTAFKCERVKKFEDEI